MLIKIEESAAHEEAESITPFYFLVGRIFLVSGEGEEVYFVELEAVIEEMRTANVEPDLVRTVEACCEEARRTQKVQTGVEASPLIPVKKVDCTPIEPN